MNGSTQGRTSENRCRQKPHVNTDWLNVRSSAGLGAQVVNVLPQGSGTVNVTLSGNGFTGGHASQLGGGITFLKEQQWQIPFATAFATQGAVVPTIDKMQKDVPEWKAACFRVAGGQTYVDPDLMQRLLYLIASEGPSTSATSLSDREMEVLRLSGQGYRPRLIADTLRLSPKTIHTHRENLKRKLHVETAADLDRFAVRWLRGEVTL